MGLILDVDGKIHAEARRESFVLYDDFGSGFELELKWEMLPDLVRAVEALQAHRTKRGKSQ